MEVVPLRAGGWEDTCTLFEQRGPRGGYRTVPAYGCWCMYWRDRALGHGEPKRAMEKLVRPDTPSGKVLPRRFSPR